MGLFRGCFREAKLLETDSMPIEGTGYIYGSFGLPIPFGGSKGGFERATSSIIVQNLDTLEKYSFILKVKDPKRFQITSLPPGNYRIDSLFLGY